LCFASPSLFLVLDEQSGLIAKRSNISIYIFDKEGNYEVFHQKEKLMDKQLGIELELGNIFS
jgi:hypothetical protein